jgi:hypothetical protein
MYRVIRAASVALLALHAAPLAAQEIQWRQTVTLPPKGHNLPKGVLVDILGIQPGDTLDEARARVKALAAEMQPVAAPSQRMKGDEYISQTMGNVPSTPITENKTQIRLPVPSGFITATFVGEITLKRDMPGAKPRSVLDLLSIRLSAPSSGQQVLGLERFLSYSLNEDQPKISDIINRLSEKLGGRPQVFGNRTTYADFRFQFDNGQMIAPPNANVMTCMAQYIVNNEGMVPSINQSGQCDVVLIVAVSMGISPDHAKNIKFTLADNERAKAAAKADYGFFGDYVRDMLKGGGTQPRL